MLFALALLCMTPVCYFFLEKQFCGIFFLMSNDINVFLVQQPLPAVQANAEFLVHMLNLRW